MSARRQHIPQPHPHIRCDPRRFTLGHGWVYRRGEGNKPEGSLVQGETVKIKDGMIFNVTATDKS